MKVIAYSYEHESGVSLQLVPESDVEKILLQSLWKHGVLEVNHTGYTIRYEVNSGD
jgi:hypothetical protein